MVNEHSEHRETSWLIGVERCSCELISILVAVKVSGRDNPKEFLQTSVCGNYVVHERSVESAQLQG
jgi:hypothetical protein